MITLSRRFKEAFKTALAVVLAYGIALSMGWEKSYWAAFAVGMISLSTAGASINKGIMRMAGTLLAAIFSLTLVGLFPQERWWFMLVLSGFVAFCADRMRISRYPYAWQVAGFVSAILCLSSIPSTENAFDLVILRTLETGLGILCYTLVTLLIWPISTAGELDAAVRQLGTTQRRLYRGYLDLLTKGPSAEDLHAIRMQELQQLDQFKQALAAAQTDTYEVWEVRRQWGRLVEGYAQLMEALERWRGSFPEVRELDLESLIPDLPALTAELDSRLVEIDRMLTGNEPQRRPESAQPIVDAASVNALSHFDRAALALFVTQLHDLDTITRSLVEITRDIRGYGSSSPPSGEEPAKPRMRFVPDLERIVAIVRVMVVLWLAYLLWIYVEIPGGITAVILVASLSLTLAVQPELPLRITFVPLAASAAFAAAVYLLVMPRLSGFAELGTLIFVVTFSIYYLFYTPRQQLGRVAGFIIFALLTGISNEQSYSFLHLVDIAAAFTISLMILSLTADIPVSSQPEKAFLRLLRRFFRSCEFLVSTLRWDPARPPSWLARWRRAYHLKVIATLPQKIALWTKFIPPKVLAGTTPEQLQTLATSIQALGFRMQETLATRGTVPVNLIGRPVQGEIDTWRTGLREIFARLAVDPDTADHAGFRGRLEAKRERLEARIEQALNDTGSARLPTEHAANAYRLFGAHRGLSEAVVAFAQSAASIDWNRLQETRF